MKGDNSINKKNWLKRLKNSLFTFGSDINQEDTVEIIEISDCEITGDKQAMIMLGRHHTEILYIRDILSNNELIKRLSPEAIRALTYILATEQQASESQIQGLKLTNMIADFIISLRPKDKKTIIQSIAKIDDNRELVKQYNYLHAKKHIYRQN